MDMMRRPLLRNTNADIIVCRFGHLTLTEAGVKKYPVWSPKGLRLAWSVSCGP